MKKHFINKIALSIVALFLCLAFINLNTVQAEKLSEQAEAISEREVFNVTNGLTGYRQKIKTLYNGITDPGNSKYAWNPHTVQWVDFSTSSSMRVVTYSGSAKDQWKQMTTRDAAKQWQKENPGWIVVAGINGDFFDNSTSDGTPATYEPTNNFMQDGDMFRAEYSTASYRNNIAWNADGSVIVGKPKISSNMYVKLYDDATYSSLQKELVINAVNKEASETGITLVTKDSKVDVDLTGYKVIVCKYSINRISTRGYVFVKGQTSSVATDKGLGKPQTGEFYLASKDGSLDDIAMNQYLKCEYNYIEDWANVKNTVGYIYSVLENGVQQQVESTVAHCYGSHPRTLVGFKENGDTVFMVVDGRGKESDAKIGATLAQCGELMRLAGCVSGYSLDGGGSSTLIIRNEFGTFDVINTPSDGSERSDGNHCLVVMRDPSYTINTDGSKYNEINVKLDAVNETLYNKMSNIKVSLGDQTLDYKPEGVKFTNLTQTTDYKVTVSYELDDVYNKGTKARSEMYHTVTTPAYEYFDPLFNVEAISKTEIKVTRSSEIEKASWVKDIQIKLGGRTYTMGDAYELVIKDLISDTNYTYHINYVIYDALDGLQYPVTGEEQSISTLSYDRAKVVEFKEQKKTDDSVTIYYEYLDSDATVKKAYILVNDEKIELASDLGYQKISIDLKMQSYDIKLVLECEKDGDLFSVESLVLHYEKEQVETPTQPETPQTPETPPVEKKKKCGKKSAELVISIITCVSLIGLAVRKRK